MTTRLGQGQSHLPADVPGISTALGQRGRLQLKGQLCQQPAGDFTKESPSRPRRQNSSNGRSAKSGRPRQDRQAWETSVTPATLGLHQSAGKTILHERIRGKVEGICLKDAGPRGKGTL
jgi:hypothetical protein